MILADASADDPDVLRLGFLLALCDVELDLLPLLEVAVAVTGDRAEMHEHIRTALHDDEAAALIVIVTEALLRGLGRGHRAPATAGRREP